MVMEATNIFTKRNLLQQAQMHNGEKNIESFTNKLYENLVKMGLPSAWNVKGNFCHLKDIEIFYLQS